MGKGRRSTRLGGNRRRLIVGLTAALAALAAVLVGSISIASAGSPGPVQVAPATITPHGAAAAGPVPAASTVAGAVVLRPRNAAALEQFAAAVSDPRSPEYGDYLAPGQFASRFGPTAASIAAVRSRLRADGLTVSSVSSNGLMMSFTGSASRVQGAFDTRLEAYRLAGGAHARGLASPARVPASIANSVTTVVGLDTVARQHSDGVLHANRAQLADHPAAQAASFSHPAGSPNPCADARDAAANNDGLTDDEIANSYGAFGLYRAGDLGAGQHIALYESEGESFLRSDLQTFDTCYFGPKRAAEMLSRLHVIPVDGGAPGGPGTGEANLDVEDVSAMAPGAVIDVYEGPTDGVNGDIYDSLDEYTAIIDADHDREVSTSYGLCEESVQQGQTGLQQAENALFEQAAAQGQTVFDASGDNGADDCNTFETPNVAPGQNPVSIDDPTDQPYVVSVGGLAIEKAATSDPTEQVWNDGPFGGGGGGGISESWAMPTWQRDAKVPGIPLPGGADYTNAAAEEQQLGFPTTFCQANVPGATASTPCRVVPDVSAQADEFTGSITVYSRAYAGAFPGGGWTTTGGTSSSSPIWAALLADINASPTCAANPTTADGVGFLSPLLYEVASNPSQYAASFTDVTTGNNDDYGVSDGKVFPATKGFDLASGLGSPILTGPGGSPGLAYYACSAAAAKSRPTITRLSRASGSVAGGEQVTITGKGFEQVSGIQVGTDFVPASDYTVTGPTTIELTMPPAVDTLAPDSPAPQDGAGPANIIVTLSNDASSATTAASRFDYYDTSGSGAVPNVTAVGPSGGSETAPKPVTITGDGFTGATRVTFGGVPAASFTVVSPTEITATPPSYSQARTTCVPLPSTGVYAGETPHNDVCQVHVQVSNANGSSATSQILAPPEGPFSTNSYGDIVLAPGCGCEGVPQPDEYDYVPAPVITSVSTSHGPGSLANENGTSVITIYGRGFDPLTINWVDIGNSSAESSEDTNFTFVSGTEIKVVALPEPPTSGTLSLPLSVSTLAGQSAPVTVRYAGSGS